MLLCAEAMQFNARIANLKRLAVLSWNTWEAGKGAIARLSVGVRQGRIAV